RGRPVIEPAFDIVAPPSLPARPGTERIELVGENGELLTSLSFSAERVADGDDSTAAHFAFVVPREALRNMALGTIRLHARGRVGTMSSAPIAAVPGAASDRMRGARTGAGAVRLTWADTRARAALVRDPSNGSILGIVRRG